MSGRGGRGGRGSRGGRGGGRGGGALNNAPWGSEMDITLDGKPSELFPEYNVPRAPVLSRKEEKQVSYFLLFREQCHDSPLYTQARTWGQGSSRKRRSRDNTTSRYGQTSKATVDPFLAVPTYSQKFVQAERTLPDLESRPFAKEFFPLELHPTLEGEDLPSGAPHKRRKTGPKTLGLSHITSLKTAEELFLPDSEEQPNGAADLSKAMQAIKTMEKRAGEGEEEGFLSGDDDEWTKDNEDEDEDNVDDPDQFESDDDDDYNAEQYFDGNQDDDDYDDGGGGDDGGEYM